MQLPEQTTIPAIVPPQDGRLAHLIEMANRMVELEQSVVRMELQLKESKDMLKLISESHLPTMMTEIGLTELTLVGGRKISIKAEYYGSVAQTRIAAAVEWLNAHNMGGIVTKEIKVEYDEGILEELRRQNFSADLKTTIHPSRLRAFVRERLEANDPDFPKELFAASQVNRAVLTDGN